MSAVGVGMLSELKLKPKPRSEVDVALDKIEAEKREKEALNAQTSGSDMSAKGELTVEERKEKKRRYMKEYWKKRTEKKAGKAEPAVSRKAEPKRREIPSAERAQQRAYQAKYRAKRRAAKLGLTAKAPPALFKSEDTPTNGHPMPVPYKFCVNCGERLPTLEHKGKVLPMAVRFCGQCGYQLPTIGGK